MTFPCVLLTPALGPASSLPSVLQLPQSPVFPIALGSSNLLVLWLEQSLLIPAHPHYLVNCHLFLRSQLRLYFLRNLPWISPCFYSRLKFPAPLLPGTQSCSSQHWLYFVITDSFISAVIICLPQKTFTPHYHVTLSWSRAWYLVLSRPSIKMHWINEYEPTHEIRSVLHCFPGWMSGIKSEIH